MSIEIIAELSSNHMGDMSLATDMIVAAAESGADFVKFQTWKVEHLKPGPWDSDGRRQIYEKAELSIDDHYYLKETCIKNNVKFLTSCFNVQSLKFIRELSDSIKIPGVESYYESLVNQSIELFDRVFISIGSANKNEYLRLAGHKNVWLMHCVSSYPCSPDCVNLPKLIRLKEETERLGYSGHYDGIWDAVAAISLGAKVIEKHFTIDRNLPFRDNKFAILPDQLKSLKQYSLEFSKMMLDKGDDCQDCEKENRNVYAGRWSK